MQTPQRRRGRQPGFSPKNKLLTPINQSYEEILSEPQQKAFLKGIIDLDSTGRTKIVDHQLPALQARVEEFCRAVTVMVKSLKPQAMAAAG
jgi:hypothetical protein